VLFLSTVDAAANLFQHYVYKMHKCSNHSKAFDVVVCYGLKKYF